MRRHAKAPSAGSTSGREIGRTAVAFACLMAISLSMAPGAQAGRVPGFGVLGTGLNGTAAGQLRGTAGLAVNLTGAGGATAGDVYVSDSTNNRVSQFSGSGTFIRAFGVDVVASGGPDNANEVQRATVNATAGTFRLTFSAKATGATGTGDLVESSTTVSNVVTSTGAFLQGEAIAGAGIPAGTTIASVGAGALTLSQAATATNNGVALAADLPYNASATLVQSALNALSTINAGGGSVAVTGGPGDGTGSSPYVITFNGAPLKGTDVAQMTGASGYLALSGGTGAGANEAKVTTSNPGNTGYEVCNVIANPSDVCQSGVSSSAAGGLAAAKGLAVDPATGNVFVVSSTGKRVNVYSATGQFQGAFGWKVNAAFPEEKLQFCTFVTGCIAGTQGASAGQLALEFESHPAISPVSGDLYVPEPANRRIAEYSVTLNGAKEVTGASFVRAFGGDVIPTVNEQQTVTISGTTGGHFSLSFKSQVTGGTASGDIAAGSNEITNLQPGSGTLLGGEEVTGPGIPAGTIATAVTFDSVTLSASATATSVGASISTDLSSNSTAAVVQKALRALTSMVGPNVTVSGAAGGPWTLDYAGALSGIDLPQLSGDGSGLTGPSPALGIATTRDGANGTSTGLEVCTQATTCKVGAGDGTGGTFSAGTPNSLAIDSAGAVYAVSTPAGCSGCRVQKFGAGGGSVEEFAPAQLSSPAGASGASVSPRLVAVDPANDHVLVAKRVTSTTFKLYEFTRTGGFIDVVPPGETGIPVSVNPATAVGPQGLAFGTAERSYVAISGTVALGTPVKILMAPPAPKATMEAVSAVGQRSATFNGLAKPSAPGAEGGFPTAAFFEYSADGVSWSSTRAVDIGTGTGSGNPNSCPTNNPPSCNLSESVDGLRPGTTYLVRMVVSNGTATTSSSSTFTTTEAAPSVERMAATEVGQDAATLTGLVNPNNRPTTYRFEWGQDTSYGTRIPVDIDAVVGSGGQPVEVSASISDLLPGTTYHFRITAKSSAGVTVGSDGEVTTLNEAGLPGRRMVEQVSPADKAPVGSVQITNALGQAYYQPAQAGDAISFPVLNGTPDSEAGGEVLYAAGRTSTGWLSQQMTAPSLSSTPTEGALANPTGYSGLVLYVDPEDLKCAFVETHNPLTADTPAADIANGIENLYRWDRDSDSYTLISNRVPLQPSLSQSLYEIAGANSSCTRVFFRSSKQSLLNGASQLYEWDNGTLRDAGMLPNGTPAAGAAGTRIRFTPNVVTPNGRFFFSAVSNQGSDAGKTAVFVRKTPGETVDASSSKTATAPSGAVIEAASPDGSHVYFMANYGLAATSSSGPNTACSAGPSNATCDLYDYNVDTGQLTDISADANPKDTTGSVTQGLMAVSDDGSSVYFAARGQLVPGRGRSYSENLTGFANVYRWHAGQVTYIGSLTNADMESAQGGMALADGDHWSSRATPDGRYFTFVSRDNLSVNNPAQTAEAYVYAADTGRTECISCPLHGPPTSTSFSRILPRNFYGQVVTGLGTDGRVFFSSLEPLAPGAIAGQLGETPAEDQVNVYEWHAGQISLLTSGKVSLLGVGGANSRDVYVQTFDQLVSADKDVAADVYDFREGGGFAAAPPPEPPCDAAAGECQGSPASSPEAGLPASAGVAGSGNQALGPPAKSGHRHKKHKKHKKHKRQKPNRNRPVQTATQTHHGGAK